MQPHIHVSRLAACAFLVAALAAQIGQAQVDQPPPETRRFRPVLTPEQQRQNRQGEAPTAPAIAPRADLLDMGSLISTSFSATIGKTVVVGSSRLDGGDEALIVLFTALP